MCKIIEDFEIMKTSNLIAGFNKKFQFPIENGTARTTRTNIGERRRGKEMISLCRKGRLVEAVELLEESVLEVDSDTYIYLLPCSANEKKLLEGKRIYSHIVRRHSVPHMYLCNHLIDTFRKCDSLVDAQKVFNQMPVKNLVSWTSMIATSIQHGHYSAALQLFKEMRLTDVKLKPDKVTYMTIFNACPCPAFLAEAKLLHGALLFDGVSADISLANALINMYDKCGGLEKSRSIFDRMPKKDVISWTSMIAAYGEREQEKDAYQLFQQMQLHGLRPNKVTMVTVLNACSSLTAIGQGKAIHRDILDSGYGADIVVGTALINMYGRCGKLEDARNVFHKMPEQDVVSWNAIISAYAQHGHGKDVLQLFERMSCSGVKPTKVTLVGVLTACNHGGMISEGCHYFISMSIEHYIMPTMEHYGCMIDLLGRSAKQDEAHDLLNRMPFSPSAAVWMTFLGVCRINNDEDQGKNAAEHVLKLDPENAGAYVVLSNIYAAAGKWNDVLRIRRAMVKEGVQKKPGFSVVEVNNTMHKFIVGDRSHPQTEQIYAKLEMLNKEIASIGYEPDTKLVLHDVEEERKGHLLFCHSEKLAVAFGIISTPDGTALRIIKNLRICNDCHNAVKFISKVMEREIVLRDVYRFHVFKGGICSCGDYW